MQLTPHQEEKGNEVIDLVRAGNKRIVLLGSAGVGKTVLSAWLAATFKRDFTINPNYNNGEVFVTAPTNKALAILKNKVSANVSFATIHSALKMRRVVNNKSGQVSFIKAWTKDDGFQKAKAALIDETSMLNTLIEGGDVFSHEEQKMVYQRGFLDDYGFPIIYIGDDKQINPVGEPFSPVFHKGYPTVELTEIIRQGAGNPIIELSRDLDMIYFKTPSLVNGKGYTYNDDRASFIEALAEVNGTDEFKYLSYTNKDVDELNISVRERVYGASPKKIETGETIVFNSPHGENYTNKEVKVEQKDIVTALMPVPKYNTKFDRDNLPIGDLDRVKLKFYRINDGFNVIHEDSETVFKSILASLTTNAAKYGWGWKAKFFFEELFADIKYNHAITIHKSQGSTYKNAILNVGSIGSSRMAEERQRLAYTGVTRASDLLILSNVK